MFFGSWIVLFLHEVPAAADSKFKPPLDSGEKIGIIAVSRNGNDTSTLEKAGQLAADSIKSGNHVSAIGGKSWKPAAIEGAAGLTGLKNDLELAVSRYYNLSYIESKLMIEKLVDALFSLRLSPAEEPGRWRLYEVAMSYISLNHLGLGEMDEFGKAARALIATRSSVVFGNEYPPEFRKEIEISRGAVGLAPKTILRVNSVLGKWNVNIDGRPMGITPVVTELPDGIHYIGIEGPDGLIESARVLLDGKSREYSINPFLTFAEFKRDYVLLHVPGTADFRTEDFSKAVEWYGLDLAVVIRSGGEGVVFGLAGKGRGRSMLLEPAAAGKGASVSSAMKDLLYGPEPFDYSPKTEKYGDTISARPWYKEWWFWTIVAGVTATAVGVPVYYKLESERAGGGTLGTAKLAP